MSGQRQDGSVWRTCCNSASDTAATFAKYLLEIRLGMVTASVGPSVSSVYAASPNMQGALFFTVSQSGRSPDILRLAEVARSGGALTVAFVNEAASPLADLCEIVLPLNAWPEKSVAATKSVIASLAAGGAGDPQRPQRPPGGEDGGDQDRELGRHPGERRDLPVAQPPFARLRRANQ